MLARRDQSHQIEHSINQIRSNPVELNHMIGFGNRIQSSSHKKWSNRMLIRFDCVRSGLIQFDGKAITKHDRCGMTFHRK